MFNIKEYNKISEFIENSGKKTKIIAISKNHDQSAVEDAISCGVKIFGENRVQEAKTKFVKIKKNNPKIELHLTPQSPTFPIVIDFTISLIPSL